MPHFRAQMNCVPGMITQFGFTPTVTTAEMRQNPDIVEKVANINALRLERQEEIESKGQELLYEFDYLLLCNKICGKSHYNMQMKIIVETQEEYDAWLSEQKTFKNSLIN
jgi:cytochrome c oxidase subunit 2